MPIVPGLTQTDPRERLKRLGRLTLKELREILRDRRTIVTLVLMPLLLYPLLSIAFQQFFLSSLGKIQRPRYLIAFQNDREAQAILRYLVDGGLKLASREKQEASISAETLATPEVVADLAPDLE